MRGSYLHDPGGHLGISHRKGISLTKPVKKGVYTAGLTPPAKGKCHSSQTSH